MSLQEVLAKSQPLINELHPVVALAAEALVKEAYRQNVLIRITDGYRSYARQNELFNQGRYGNAGPIVTTVRGGESFHNHRVAIDFVLLESGYDMKADKDKDGEPDWLEVAAIGKMLGFVWGGDWKSFKDNPHFEMTFGLKARDYQMGKQPNAAVVAAAKTKILTLTKAWEAKEDDKEMEELKVLAEEVKTLTKGYLEMEKRVKKLEDLHNYPNPPEWSWPAIEAAKDSNAITSSKGRSYDFLCFLQVLLNLGLIKKIEKGSAAEDNTAT